MFATEFSCKVLSILVLAFVLSGVIQPAFAIPETVSVRLFEARESSPVVYLKSSAELIYPHGLNISLRNKHIEIRARGLSVALYMVSGKKKRLLVKSNKLILKEVSSKGIALKFPKRSNLRYRGEIILKSRNSYLEVTNKVTAREFVYGVVTSELPRHFLPAAKKSLAVLTLSRLEFLPENKTIGDSTKSELYTGTTNVSTLDKELIDSVWKKRLYYNDSLVLPYYHSTCAGSTSTGVDFFKGSGEDLSYLSSVKCRHCKNSPFFEMKQCQVPKRKVTEIFGQVLPVVLKRDKAGRPMLVKVGHDAKPISGYKTWIKLGRNLGWSTIPGTRFYLKAKPSSIEIQSNGAGHGVGLCQWGANGLAYQNYDYAGIIKYYYPLCEIK